MVRRVLLLAAVCLTLLCAGCRWAGLWTARQTVLPAGQPVVVPICRPAVAVAPLGHPYPSVDTARP